MNSVLKNTWFSLKFQKDPKQIKKSLILKKYKKYFVFMHTARF